MNIRDKSKETYENYEKETVAKQNANNIHMTNREIEFLNFVKDCLNFDTEILDHLVFYKDDDSYMLSVANFGNCTSWYNNLNVYIHVSDYWYIDFTIKVGKSVTIIDMITRKNFKVVCLYDKSMNTSFNDIYKCLGYIDSNMENEGCNLWSI